MIRSMTGFGQARTERDDLQIGVELRTVNNRYFKSLLRMPDSLLALEAELDAALRKHIHRGSVTLTVNLTDISPAATGVIHRPRLDLYLQTLYELAENETVKQLNGGLKTSLDLGQLLNLPGVIVEPASTDRIERIRPLMMPLIEEACKQLNAMRDREGKGLADDLSGHLDAVQQRLEQVAQRGPSVVEEYHTRLRQRIDELMARAQLKVDEVDLIREVGIFAERCDISEEVQRLTAHIEQFREIIGKDDGQPVGRTLDFLAQEMLREANTIASKSNDALIGRTIVEVKGAIDRIKEQVQNVE